MIDFIFGMTITAGVSFILLGLCFTMAVVEIGQYVAFSTSRAYFAAHNTEQDQIDRGRQKFDKLMLLKSFKGMLRSDWFKLTYIESGDFRDQFPESKEHDSDTFFGTRLKFRADVLNLNLPMIGSTFGNYDAIIQSFLGREPTWEECRKFEEKRWENFSIMFPLSVPVPGGTSAYAMVIDNGC